MTDQIRDCWAFHRDGTRCDMPAGHPGEHSATRTWDDSDCFDPTSVVKTPAPTPPAVEHLTANPVPTRCALCNHGWHESRCTGMDGDFACDCAAGVPD